MVTNPFVRMQFNRKIIWAATNWIC